MAKIDERFSPLATIDEDKAPDPIVMRAVRRRAQFLELPGETLLDLIVMNDRASYGRETWIEVMTELLSQQPSPLSWIDKPSCFYVGRFTVDDLERY